MMRKQILVLSVLIGLLILVCSFQVLGADKAAQKSQEIDLIIEKSGIQSQFADITALLLQKMGINENGDEKQQQIAEIIKDNFAVENIIHEIKLVFSEQFSEANAKKVIDFYRSELATKITRLEIESSNQLFYEKMKNFDLNNYNLKRQQIITRFIDDIKALDFYYLLQSSIIDSLLAASNALTPEDKQVAPEVIAEVKNQIKDQVYSEQNKKQLLHEYLLIYEKASDDELTRYSKFVSSKHGEWMNNCIKTGIINAFKKSTTKMIAEMAKLSKPTEK